MTITVANNAKAAFYNSVDGTVEIDDIVPRWPYVGYETPDELTGVSAIHIPTYNEVAHLMVLDKNWVIVAIDLSTDLFDEIDTLSSGSLQTDYDAWVAAVAAGVSGSDYTTLNNMRATRASHMGVARVNVGEKTLETTTAWGITSADDSNYTASQNPTTASRYCYAAGNDTTYLPDVPPGTLERDSGPFKTGYLVYCYIEFPTPMVDGKTYTITTLTTKTVTFLFDKKKTISRAIKTNQAGYMSDAVSNKAYMGAFLYEDGVLDLAHATAFDVIDASDGTVALSGTPALAEADPIHGTSDSGTTDGVATNKLIQSGQDFTNNVEAGDIVYNTPDVTTATITFVDSDTQLTLDADIMTSGQAYTIKRRMYGEDVYEMDFSALAVTGTYYISVAGVGRSWPFEHSTTAFDYAAYTALRGMYHHRAGSELTTKHTYWPRRKAKTGPYYYECEHIFFPQHDPDTPGGYTVFTVIQNTLDVNDFTTQAAGGHHDAADWDCRGFHYSSIANMLYAFQLNTNLTSDTWLDLPDSGNGVPDILKEALHGLEVWRLSQDGVTGGVSGYLETITHPRIIHPSYSTGTPFRKPHYAYGQRTRWSSLMFAACAAHYARLVQPYDATSSTLYQTAAENAYTFGNDAGNSLGSTTLGGYAWTELQSHVDPYLMWAKLQLYLLTTTESYLTNAPSVVTLEGTIPNPYVYPWWDHDYSGWIYYSIMEASAAGYTGLDSLAATWSAWFTSRADGLVAEITNQAYEKAHDRDASAARWALQQPTMHATALIIAHQEATAPNKPQYRDALIKNLDFMLGANPLGVSWCTGIGYVYPVFLANQVSSLEDDIMDPLPGITLYGLVGEQEFSSSNLFLEDVWMSWLPGDGDITSLTQTGGVATCTTVADHGLNTGDRIQIVKSSVSEYNIAAIATVTGVKTFTYPISTFAAASASSSGGWKAGLDWTYDTHRELQPRWRRFMQHPTFNIPQNEYTIQDSIASMLLSTAYLYSGGAVTQKTPRDPDYLWGRWLLA